MSSKRSKLPRRVEYTKTFAKSWERYNKAGRRDMNDMAEVMAIIFSGKEIPPEYSDHELQGAEWGGSRELHVGGDFLLVYRIDKQQNLLTFINLGTHSELFG
ncbi:type II toxin-antitoxin system YafQ family toxin [Erwiniaceae bacterium BAC15a-03b]|uniref:Type II toxin-antitoxin system YafQ family toxin n=1 Tax=Winslowiella arboricola TaxID=2978220 RepID=A0A9J6PS45_9GAMM|nr:type II toxin-antitoxin system YafQ family toxin [Winslowiella arboricola]MCU5775624.1 type II toxin-antitoxin system YafQ family toxin [Winslowiella arboricola]MCU5779526.1 type II toxin-antitoxin system YafQ family toxin [Winslowiella arboricola]